MSRHCISVNENVFRQLYRLPGAESVSSNLLAERRYVATSPDERAWLMDSRFTIESITPNLQFIGISKSSEEMFGVIGPVNWPSIPEGLQEIPLNAGIFAALVSDLNLKTRNVSFHEIHQYVLPHYMGVDSYIGHSVDEISKYFTPICLYTFDSAFGFSARDIFRAGSYWALHSEDLLLKFEDEVLEAFKDLIVFGVPGVPYENVLRSLLSAHWPHAFLELYRCVEAVFAFPIFESFHKNLRVSMSLPDFVQQLERETRWRPKEEDSLIKLVEHCNSAVSSKISTYLPLPITPASATPVPITQRAAKWLYALRNSVVHFRRATERGSLTESEWNRVLRGMASLVEEVYSLFGKHIL